MKKKVIIILIVVIAIVLLFPIPFLVKDGGSIEFRALLYTITKYHQIDINSTTGYKDGIGIKLLGMEIYNSTKRNEKTPNSIPATNNTSSKINGVVVKASDKTILVMEIDNTSSLYTVSTKGNNFNKGQEVEIYFDGTIMETYPAQLGNVSEIVISKEKSDIEIPETILRYAYSSKNNVSITINEISSLGMTITIKDINKLPYKYTNNYIIHKKIKNENYTGVGEEKGSNSSNSTSSFTRYWA